MWQKNFKLVIGISMQKIMKIVKVFQMRSTSKIGKLTSMDVVIAKKLENNKQRIVYH